MKREIKKMECRGASSNMGGAGIKRLGLGFRGC